jgi:hypothetical protein
MKPFYFRLILSVVLCLIWTFSVLARNGDLQKEFLLGGPCEYKRYEGHARIVSITKQISLHAKLNDRYEVKFIFIPLQEIKESFAATERKEFLLTLADSSYPGPKFLDKYGIQVGKVLACYMKVIVKGTCTPILFEFPSIRLDDYLAD